MYLDPEITLYCCRTIAASSKKKAPPLATPPPPPRGGAARQDNELKVVAMTICLCHGGICELSIRCSWLMAQGGDRHLAQKAQETLGTEGAEAIFFRLHWNWGWGGERPRPLPPPMGGTGLTLGGGITKGGG